MSQSGVGAVSFDLMKWESRVKVAFLDLVEMGIGVLIALGDFDLANLDLKDHEIRVAGVTSFRMGLELFFRSSRVKR